jgi:hypothetical protein
MSAYVSLAKDNRALISAPRTNALRFPVHRTILRMKRKGKMANIYKSNVDPSDSDFYVV